MHPMGAVERISLYNMIVILLSVIFAAIVVAISIARHLSFGLFNGTGIAREDVALPLEGAEQSRVDGPIKQKLLIVLLPDGKLVSPREPSRGNRPVFSGIDCPS